MTMTMDHHAVRDGEGILQPAGPVRHHRHRDLHQPVWAAGAARLKSSPTRHRAGPLWRLLLSGQTHRSDVLVHLKWFRQLPDGDVVLVVLGPAVVLMDGEADHSPPLLGALVHTPVVLSGHNLHLIRGPVGAVGGRHHVARAEDWPATEVEVVRLPPEADLEGDRVRLGLLSPHDPSSVLVSRTQHQTRQ